MTRKINEMILRNQRKQEQLQGLRKQLQIQKDIYEKHQKDLTSKKYSTIAKQRNEDILSPERAYQKKGTQTLVDQKELSRPLDYTKLDSVMEIKSTLQGKLALLEQRHHELDSQAFVFRKMIKSARADLVHDQQRQNDV